MNAIATWDDVPIFESEQTEALFWGETRVESRMMESSMMAGGEMSDSVTITLRIDPRMLSRVKRLARSRFLNYQSMIKQWISERLENELRDR